MSQRLASFGHFADLPLLVVSHNPTAARTPLCSRRQVGKITFMATESPCLTLEFTVERWSNGKRFWQVYTMHLPTVTCVVTTLFSAWGSYAPSGIEIKLKRFTEFVYLKLLCFAVQDDTIVLLLEPLHGVFLCQTMGEANLAGFASPVGYVETWKN